MATSSDSASLLDYGRNVTNGLGRITEGIMTSGKGSYVEYDDGRKMLDFTCGIGVTSLGECIEPPHYRLVKQLQGHCHPKISKAAADQCMNIVHAQVNYIAFIEYQTHFRSVQHCIPRTLP
jgi:4-aminobutyrate aminotransferase